MTTIAMITDPSVAGRTAAGRQVTRILVAALLCAASAFAAGDFTRGVGVYPGDPAAFHGPTLVPEIATYRNLALHRPATASNNYDFSLTAQLITDGIIDHRLPGDGCRSNRRGVMNPERSTTLK
jgi:hypothetical protein